MTEPIEFHTYPLWEQQPGEPDKCFDHFHRFFLPVSNANLVEAYRHYKHGLGDDPTTVNDASGVWREECRIYRWRERHKAYWRAKAQENLEWRQEQARRLIDKELELSRKMLAKAEEILDLAVDPEQDKLKDAATLTRTASELNRKALAMDDSLTRAIDLLSRHGLEINDPSLGELLSNLRIGA